jgi:hypothetical protein
MTYLTRDRGLAGLSGGIDWSKIGGDLGGQALNQAAQAAVGVPSVTVNRARVAAAVDAAYAAADQYQEVKPGLFVAGVVGALASGYALSKRRKNPEAVTLYSLTGLASLAVAWFTRPDALVRAAPAPAQADPNAPGFVKSGLSWADARVARRSAEAPGWEARALTRLMGDLGTGTMAPAVTTLLTKNAH